MIRFIYTLLLTLISPILLFTLYRSKPGKPPFGPRWKEHFGLTPKLENSSKAPIWVHCVSVGETIAAIPFIQALKEKYPSTPIVITTTTSTGAQQAEKISHLAEHRYMPIDLPFAIKGFIRNIQPQKMLIMETELWPNTIYYAAKAGIKISVINARLSQRSANKYKKFPPIFKLLSNGIDKILCQNSSDAERFYQLGIHKKALEITGSLKFDLSIDPEIIQSGQNLRSKLGEKRPVWIAASTHDNEEEFILAVHRTLLTYLPNALLILVPRHPERFDYVAKLCLENNFKLSRRTTQTESSHMGNIYLADTMGEMMLLIQAADICFMGGSLIGDKVGGHNVLEPAALGKPIITGPSYYNFKEIIDMLQQINAIQIVKTQEELLLCLLDKFQSKESPDSTLKSFIEEHSGAVKRTIKYI